MSETSESLASLQEAKEMDTRMHEKEVSLNDSYIGLKESSVVLPLYLSP